jgi:hypothetical protein
MISMNAQRESTGKMSEGPNLLTRFVNRLILAVVFMFIYFMFLRKKTLNYYKWLRRRLLH